MTQEALKLALDALEDFSHKACYDNGEGEIGSRVCCEVLSYKAHDESCKVIKAITAIKEALAQPENDNSAVHLTHCYQGEYPVCKYGDENCPAIPKVKTRPEQELVAWMTQARNFIHLSESTEAEAKLYGWKAVYTHLQRTWVGLTDEEMEDTFIQCGGRWNGDFWEIEDADFHPFLRTIEAKLKERNT